MVSFLANTWWRFGYDFPSMIFFGEPKFPTLDEE